MLSWYNASQQQSHTTQSLLWPTNSLSWFFYLMWVKPRPRVEEKISLVSLGHYMSIIYIFVYILETMPNDFLEKRSKRLFYFDCRNWILREPVRIAGQRERRKCMFLYLYSTFLLPLFFPHISRNVFIEMGRVWTAVSTSVFLLIFFLSFLLLSHKTLKLANKETYLNRNYWSHLFHR